MTSWQPIANAPKDGREFIACYGHQQNVMLMVRWSRHRNRWETKGEPVLGFLKNATSWHSLPEPPNDT